MIGRLRGMILEKQPPQVVLEIQGVAYEIQMPMTCFYELPEQGIEAIIFTHFVVREDAQLLYGFNNKQERALFRELIKVNGVGPKLALAILSGMSAAQFVDAVEHQRVSTLVKLPGVGQKTAERLVVEMKDRFKGLSGDLFNHREETSIQEKRGEVALPELEKEAVAALISLGYKPQEASRMVNQVTRPGKDSETLIRDALRAVL